MNIKYKFTKKTNIYNFLPELLKYLNLDLKLYSMDEISHALLVKTNSKECNEFIKLDSEGYELFNIDNFIDKIKLNDLLWIISHKFIDYSKYQPTCDFYQYNQEPIDI